MGRIAVGLVIGLALGFTGGWLFTSVTAVNPVRDKLARQETLNRTNTEEVGKLQSELDALAAKNETDLAAAEDKLAAKDSRIKDLEVKSKKLGETLEEALREHEKKTAEAAQPPEPADTSSEKTEPDEDVKAIKEVMDRMKRITTIGGPLNDAAVKELGLDENQVAGINQVLKDEGERMHERLAQWAAGLLEDKTAEDLMKMSDLEISVAIMPHIQDELDILRKLDPEERRKINVEKHFIKFLPKDAKMTRIVKALYEERQRTYESMAAYVDEEQEKAMKEKYFQPGTFVFPGGAGYGMGQLTPEDFER